MRRSVWGVSVCTLAVSLALPGLILAQEPVAPPVEEAPPPTETVPEEPAPEVPAESPPTTPVPEPPPTETAEPPPAPASVAKASAAVSMVDYSFSPATVTINVGDSVTWTNNGEEDHDAAGNGFSTGTVAPGASGSATFSSAGRFAYICTFHPGMKGTVVVSDTGGSGTTPSEDGTVDPETGAPIGSEAAAGAAADAAGSADALPASGEPEGPLVVLGAGLLACGLVAMALARWRSREGMLLPPSA